MLVNRNARKSHEQYTNYYEQFYSSNSSKIFLLVFACI